MHILNPCYAKDPLTPQSTPLQGKIFCFRNYLPLMLLNHQPIGKLKNQVLLNAFKLKQLQTPINL